MSVESTKRIEGLAYHVTSHSFQLRVDVEEKLGGANSAPNPHDYLEIALAGCTAITVQMYAQRKAIPLESCDIKIKITAEGASNEISREIKFIGHLTGEQKDSLLRIAEKCPVHRFLTAGAKIQTRVVV